MRLVATVSLCALVGCGGASAPASSVPPDAHRMARTALTSSATDATPVAASASAGAPSTPGVDPFAVLSQLTAERDPALRRRPVGSRVVPLDYASLPIAAPAPNGAPTLHAHFGGGDGAPLVVAVDARVFADIVVGGAHFYTMGRFAAQADPCRSGAAPPRATAYALRTAGWSDDGVDVEWLGGPFDRRRCEATLAVVKTARARGWLGGLVYAVREVAPPTVGGERLWLVMPGLVSGVVAPPTADGASGPYTRVVLRTAPGSNAALHVAFSAVAIDRWRAHDGVDDAAFGGAAISLTMELAWPRGAPAPALVATLTALDPSSPGAVDALLRDPSRPEVP